MSIDPNDILLSGGAPAFKFENIGDTVKGEVVSAEARQQTDYATGDLKTWKDGKPMMEVVVTLQTDLRNDGDDDGQRRIFVRGQMTTALRDALKAANARLEPGGTLAVQFTGTKPSETRGFQPAKQFVAQYVPGAPAAVNDLLGANTTHTTDTAPVAAASLL